MKAKLEAIQATFSNQAEDDALQALKNAVGALSLLGVPTHAACHIVTHWAVEEGIFDSEDEAEAERQAEKEVASA